MCLFSYRVLRISFSWAIRSCTHLDVQNCPTSLPSWTLPRRAWPESRCWNGPWPNSATSDCDVIWSRISTTAFFDVASITAAATSITIFGFCLTNSRSLWRFNGHFPGEPGLAGTRMSPFWNLLELMVMEVVSGDNWSYKTCKAPVKMSPPTNQHPAFFTGRMSFLSPNQQCQSTEGKFVQLASFQISLRLR